MKCVHLSLTIRNFQNSKLNSWLFSKYEELDYQYLLKARFVKYLSILTKLQPLCPGEAEPGGQGGHAPPKKFEWVGQGMICPPPPPKILTTPLPKWAASGQNLCQIASEHLEMWKIFKICGLRRADMGITYLSGYCKLFQSEFFYLIIFVST